jgi:hypothetical protein
MLRLVLVPLAVLVAASSGDFVAQSHKVRAAPLQPCPISGPPYPSTPVTFAGGSLWIACPGRGVILQARVSDGVPVRAWRAGRAPSSVAPATGGVWLQDDVGALLRLDTRGHVEARVAVDRPYGVWTGAGSVWTLRFGGNELLRIDPARGRIADRHRIGTGPSDVAFGARAAWIADHGDGGVYRVDVATGRVERRARLRGTPISIAFAGGSVWVTGPGLGLVRVDAATGRTETVASLAPDGGIGVIAAGVRVYAVGGGISPDLLVRVDTRTGVATSSRLHAAARNTTAVGLAAGAGRVWLLDGSTGRLVRLPR